LNQQEAVDVSFILERKSTESGNSPGKMGIFSIALVMCVCCFSSFFQPLSSSLVSGSSSLVSPQASLGGPEGVGGRTMMLVGAEVDQS